MSDNATLDLNLTHVERIARELKIKAIQVGATMKLLQDGATVPFISRYRKEATGMLDEVQIQNVKERAEQLVALDDRRAAILKSLQERQLLTDKLRLALDAAQTLTAMEDIFAPYRPKRRTRATVAKEKGLEPLAEFLEANQLDSNADPQAAAAAYINTEHADETLRVKDAAEALAGARDIIAERISDQAEVRAALRKLYADQAMLSCKVMMGKEKEEEAQKYRDYFEWSEPLKQVPSHRMLAIRRGEKEGFLLMRIALPSEESAESVLHSMLVRAQTPCGLQIKAACSDSFKRLISFGMETEFRLESKKKADSEAVRVFADNLRELLLAAPLGQKRVLGVDPGFRTGCKLVALDAQGKLLHNDVIYLLGEGNSLVQAKNLILTWVERFKIEAVAIGNGTASRETETFIRRIGLPKDLPIIMVNESGASIYSASEVARDEFPNHDVTVRGAVSIARRLMDPLAELVKIDPKSIGVGQYQHDVDARLLKDSLDHTVMSCVNSVGVELNTASKQLLSYVSGLNATHAANIVAFRNENGPFASRRDLLKVPRLGDKAFEQAAGFLRIRGASHPLDGSAVHPERYALVERMAADVGCSVADLISRPELRQRIELKRYVSEEVGLPTLQDIMEELNRPGRDPRQRFEVFQFADTVHEMKDLEVGMKLPGVVTNVTAFGAFIDIGVHQDGLAHVSQLSDQFVRDPSEAVKVGQRVMATVLEVDIPRKRIALSLKSKPDFERRAPGGGGPRPAGGPGPRPSGPRPTGGGMGNPFGGLGGGGGGGGGDWFSQAANKGRR
jgi:uncharacterized protein